MRILTSEHAAISSRTAPHGHTFSAGFKTQAAAMQNVRPRMPVLSTVTQPLSGCRSKIISQPNKTYNMFKALSTNESSRGGKHSIWWRKGNSKESCCLPSTIEAKRACKVTPDTEHIRSPTQLPKHGPLYIETSNRHAALWCQNNFTQKGILKPKRPKFTYCSLQKKQFLRQETLLELLLNATGAAANQSSSAAPSRA